jgi:hypothetical protein
LGSKAKQAPNDFFLNFNTHALLINNIQEKEPTEPPPISRSKEQRD